MTQQRSGPKHGAGPQVVGTFHSYHQAPPQSVFSLLASAPYQAVFTANKQNIPTRLAFTHQTLTQQLNAGALNARSAWGPARRPTGAQARGARRHPRLRDRHAGRPGRGRQVRLQRRAEAGRREQHAHQPRPAPAGHQGACGAPDRWQGRMQALHGPACSVLEQRPRATRRAHISQRQTYVMTSMC